VRVLLGIGSNIDPRRHVAEACARLARDSEVLSLSRPWWTPPVGNPRDPPFLNLVAVLETARRPVALRRWLQAIEHDHRRVRTHDRNAPRTLDLDVLAIDEGEGWAFRADLEAEPFHLLPMRDILPQMRLPDGRTVREAAEANPLPSATPALEPIRALP
jgi:2-amino-4-hydroxy-6-hydroxymethyldihydropteridine diphosphokinase